MYRFSAFGTLSGRRTSAFRTLKTMALAPMARANVSTAVRANPGAFRNCRKASRRSAFILPLFRIMGLLHACPGLYHLYALSRAVVPFNIARPLKSDHPGISRELGGSCRRRRDRYAVLGYLHGPGSLPPNRVGVLEPA